MFKKTSLLLIAVTLLVSLLGAVVFTGNPASAVTAADWRAGRIIDDGLFTYKDAMSVAEVQAFLSNRVGTGGYDSIPGQCDTNGTRNAAPYNSNITRASYAASIGKPTKWTCLNNYYEVPKTSPGPGVPANNYGSNTIPAGAKSAAQLIWDAAQAYNISPKVLLVTIHKESAGPLTTDDWPWQNQYTYAMGAYCPDSGPNGSANCDPNYAGFSIQILESAALMRWYLDNMNQPWWSYKKPGNNTILYNPNTGCGSSNVYIETKATAALYTYTPYQPNQAALNNLYGTGDGCSAYGNRNFWRIYNDWFGSTQFPQPIGGALYHRPSTGVIYLVTDGTRYQVPDWDMMINYGLDSYPVQTVSDETIQTLTDGGLLTNLTYDGNGVYLVNNRTRHPVTADMCPVWGLSCGDGAQVKPLGVNFQTLYLQQGGLLPPLLKTGNAIYKISAGIKQPIANSKTLSDLGLTTTPAISGSSVNSRQALGPLLMTTPGIVQFTPDPRMYYYDGTNYLIIGDMDTYYDWRLNQISYLPVPLSSYNFAPPTSNFLNSWVTSNSKQYIVDQGRKLLIPDNLANIWQMSQFTAPPVSLFNSLPDDTLSQLVLASPQIYVLDGGTKHYVQTIDEYTSLLNKFGKITNIGPGKITSITQGNDALVDGSLVLVQNGSGIIYVVNNNRLTHVPSPNVFDAYGYNWGSVRAYPTTILDDYPTDGLILNNSRASDNSYYIVSGSSLYILSNTLANDFGPIDAKFIPITKQAVKKNASMLSRFLLNTDDGRVYYATDGALHYVSSYESFLAYGGGNTPRTSVTTNTIECFVIGQPI